MDPLRFYTIVVGSVAGASLLVGYLLAKRRKSPEQRERERRARINRVGRITVGTVVDLYEEPGSNGHASVSQLLVFNYDVAGVTYEASQDITHLRQYIDLKRCKLGLPASIKYDPQNPGNSLVVSENWMGLRQ